MLVLKLTHLIKRVHGQTNVLIGRETDHTLNDPCTTCSTDPNSKVVTYDFLENCTQQSPNFKSGTIKYSPVQHTKSVYKQCNFKEKENKQINNNLPINFKKLQIQMWIWQNQTQFSFSALKKRFSFLSDNTIFFYKLICTRPWDQINSSRPDHQRQWA